jgi:anti-sigma regulatory factor (Ser/Thr protein kinase)
VTTQPVRSVTRDGFAGPDCVDGVHDLLAELWTGAPDVDERDRTLFEIAVVELVGNLVEHGRPRPLECGVTLAVYTDRLDAVLWDRGDDPDVDLDGAALPDPLAETGRGLPMARAALDVLTHERLDGTNRWHLSRVRTG